MNKLSKHVEQITREKQALLRQVEQEEEYITNTLVKKLELVRQEKVDLENKLEQEEELITNKLQKQLMTVMNDKRYRVIVGTRKRQTKERNLASLVSHPSSLIPHPSSFIISHHLSSSLIISHLTLE